MKQFYSVLRVTNRSGLWACSVVCETISDEKYIRDLAIDRDLIVTERISGLYRDSGIFLNDLPAYED